MIEQKENHIILDIGLIHSKIGTAANKLPFKIVDTPSSVFMNEEFLEKEYFQLYKSFTDKLKKELEEFFYSLFFDHLNENVKNRLVLVGLNIFVADYMLEAIEDVLKEKLGAG